MNYPQSPIPATWNNAQRLSAIWAGGEFYDDDGNLVTWPEDYFLPDGEPNPRWRLGITIAHMLAHNTDPDLRHWTPIEHPPF
jgi:hypothetical protein